MNSKLTPPCPICGDGIGGFSTRALLYPGRERELFTCDKCQASFFWPHPTSDEIASCYSHIYFRDFFKQYWKDYYKGRAFARTFLPRGSSGNFLDVGCALGTFLAGLRDASGWNVLGLEYSAKVAELGQRLNKLTIAGAGLTHAPWPDAHFDYIHINNVLEHESVPVEAISAAARLLKPGGRLQIILPNGPVDCLPNVRLFRRHGRAFRTRHGGHIFYFSRRSLMLLLERMGFKNISIKNFHFKSGLKARGWTPHADRLYFEEAQAPAPEAEAEMALASYQALIPKPPNWPLYYASYRWRLAWRISGCDWGYDYEVLAEKSK